MMHPVARHCLGGGGYIIPEYINIIVRLGNNLTPIPDGGSIDGWKVAFGSNSSSGNPSLTVSFPSTSSVVTNRVLTLRLPVSSDLREYIRSESQISGNYLKMITITLLIRTSYGVSNKVIVGKSTIVDPDNLIDDPLDTTQNVRVINTLQSEVINYYYRSNPNKVMELQDIYKLDSVEFTTL